MGKLDGDFLRFLMTFFEVFVFPTGWSKAQKEVYSAYGGGDWVRYQV